MNVFVLATFDCRRRCWCSRFLSKCDKALWDPVKLFGNKWNFFFSYLRCRFRSITKQYFRKADGVIVFYDVTMETSFLNIKNWMISVEVIRCLKQQQQANKKVSRFHFTLIGLCLVTVELFLSEISIIQSSPLHCRHFFWSQRYQTTYSPYLSNCWFARDVTAAMLVGKSQGITKLHYLSKICREKFYCIDHQNGRLVKWFQLRMRTRPCVPFVSILRNGVSWLKKRPIQPLLVKKCGCRFNSTDKSQFSSYEHQRDNPRVIAQSENSSWTPLYLTVVGF